MGRAGRDLVANFEAVETTYSVNVFALPEEGGEVSGGDEYQAGDRVTVTATAKPGYTFIYWTEGSSIISNKASYTFTMGAADRNLYANFQDVGCSWPKGIRVKATTVTDTTVTLTLSGEVPEAEGYMVYYDGWSLYFDNGSVLTLTIEERLSPNTQYTFTVQAVYSDGETEDGPSVKVRTKK